MGERDGLKNVAFKEQSTKLVDHKTYLNQLETLAVTCMMRYHLSLQCLSIWVVSTPSKHGVRAQDCLNSRLSVWAPMGTDVQRIRRRLADRPISNSPSASKRLKASKRLSSSPRDPVVASQKVIGDTDQWVWRVPSSSRRVHRIGS